MTPRETADLLIEPRWLLPVAPANVVLEGHAVALRGGRILAVGPASELRQRWAPRECLVREQHALLPGLVNAHTRSCHTLLGDLGVRGPRRSWLDDVVAPLERRALGADLVRDGLRLAIAQMLRAGITCFADLSPLPEEAARTVAAAQVRALIGMPVSDLPSCWAEDATTHLAKAEALWDEYRDHPRVGLYFAPLPLGGLLDATLARVRRVADELEARVALHVEELVAEPGSTSAAFAAAVADADPAVPPLLPGLVRLQRLGLLRPGFSAIGALGCERAAQELLLRHGASLIACPQAELRLGARPAALPRSLDERLALGTDSPAAAGALDLLAETRLAALLSGWRALDALRIATLGGAAALGLGAQIGSIEPGKVADLTCIELEGSALRGGSVADALLFGAVRSQVSDVWTAGRAAVSGGRLLVFDAAQLAALPRLWAERLTLEAAA
jgi:5-methylthioadenosine/S-adenosylhomocysteine deaminase